MITSLSYNCSLSQLNDAEKWFFNSNKEILNTPNTNFFYDPWVIKEEYKTTVWDSILNSLPFAIGQARLITLAPGACYQVHSDIDDRFHLNITGENCYLINLDTTSMYKTDRDGTWYDMDAGFRHSAVNFGVKYRKQLVVRKLLPKNKLLIPVRIRLTSTLKDPDDTRFLFDNVISPWLNRSIKKGTIDKFTQNKSNVEFEIEENYVDELNFILPNEFIKDII